MPSVGPSYPTAAASGSSPWTWGSPANIEGNTSFATHTVPTHTDGISPFLTGTDFGFSVPVGATINGIVVSLYRKVSSTLTFFVNNNTVRLVLSGTSFGTAKSGGSTWTNTATQDSYGSAIDDWNASPTSSDVNDSTFGFEVNVAYDNESSSNKTMSVNAYQVTVYYTLASGVSGCQCSAIIGV